MSCLAVSEGLKVISSPFATIARLFFSSRVCVRERPSLIGRVRGSNLASSRPTMFLAAPRDLPTAGPAGLGSKSSLKHST